MFNKNGKRPFIFGHNYLKQKLLFIKFEKNHNAKKLFRKIPWQAGICFILSLKCRSIRN